MAERGDATGRGTRRLVLASASPRRRDLLARLGLEPELRPVELDETPHPGEAAQDLAVRLARSKVEVAAAAAWTDSDAEVVLAADTVVTIDGLALGKPRNAADATAMLERLSGRTHTVITGLAVRFGPQTVSDLVRTGVTFRSLTPAEMAWYLATGEPFDKAGGYGLQGAGGALVSRIDGSDTNVIGLPLAETIALLRRCGLDPLVPPSTA